MTDEEYQELLVHVEELERTSANARDEAKRLLHRNFTKSSSAGASAAAFEIAAIWLRGFMRRHGNQFVKSDDLETANNDPT